MKLHAVAIAVALAAIAGCQRGMYDQPRYEPLEETDFAPFEDHRSSRHLVPGTVARGQLQLPEHRFTGRENGDLVNDYPFPVTPEVLARGQERYGIYCSLCHGYDGQGLGLVVRRGFKRPPSFHEQRLRDATTGYYFETITNGFGVMPSYKAQIKVDDRWAIIAYVRALQLSQNADLDEYPDLENEPGAEQLKGTVDGE